MIDELFEMQRGQVTISTDRRRLDLDVLLAMLRASHWAGGMTREGLDRAVANSLCFGAYDTDGRMVGFARAVTDLATYAYLTDVIVAEASRGRGIGTMLVESILAHPDTQGLRRIALFTRDAPALYAKFGFGPAKAGSNYMELRRAL
ncbi:MAG: GNAT family N-acetyltransferase [Gemmatimonadota bacterium]|nr:GNAT family N-acetyltransferase [Gemmatimonadota bacterium]